MDRHRMMGHQFEPSGFGDDRGHGGGRGERRQRGERGGGHHRHHQEEQVIQPSTGHIPPEVVEYLIYFQVCISANNTAAIARLYQTGWNELTEKYFRNTEWPTPQKVEEIELRDPASPYRRLGDDSVFMYLYKEQYYRYIYAILQRGPGLKARLASYSNYNDLFSLFLGKESLTLTLPDTWLWDIIDEFIYQFQSFCTYKANPQKRDKADIDGVEEDDAHEAWNIYPVLNMLYMLVGKSQVCAQLEAQYAGQAIDAELDEFGESALHFKLGYFSLIGLFRLHVLLADYEQALREIRHIRLDGRGIFNEVPACYVTMYHLLGFTYMMRRDYARATGLFVNALLYIQRSKQQKDSKAVAYDVVGKANDQIYHLLSICMALQPQRIDDSVNAELLVRHEDRMAVMAKGDQSSYSEFERAFFSGSPKFISPVEEFSDSNISKEPAHLQCRIFVEEIQQLAVIPLLRGYLKLYTTLTVAKLADFMRVSEDECLSRLMCFKHKLTATAASAASSDGADDAIDDADRDDAITTTSADLDFYVDDGMIHVADTRVTRHVGDYFVKHIQKLKEIEERVKNLKVAEGSGLPVATQHQQNRGGQGGGNRERTGSRR